jgi:cation diffusion facilitator family transporter
MGSSLVTILGFKLASKPADPDHPYGHGRFEYISALIVSGLIMIMGFELLKTSVEKIIHPVAPKLGYLSVIILSVSVILKLWMFFFNRKLSKKINSSALKATAQDCVNDAIATSVILACAIITMFVKLPFNLDAVTAIGVGLFIAWSGISSAKETLDELLGKPPEKEQIEEIEREILAFQNFLGVHDLLIHNYGPGRQFASVHVEVPQNTDIVTCHEQIDLCEKLVCERTGIELVIHMDPIDTDNSFVSETRQKLSEAIKMIDNRLTLHDFRMTPQAKKRTNLIFDVVIPTDFKFSDDTLKEEIAKKAKEINETFCCVITIDNDYTGN